MAAHASRWQNRPMARNKESTQVQFPAMLAVGQRNDVLLWRQQSGVFRQMEAPHTPVRVGLPGIADVGMVVSVTVTPEMVGKTIGVAVQAEMKTTTGRQSEPQRSWQRAVQHRGGVYAVIRSADEMTQLVADVQAGKPWR